MQIATAKLGDRALSILQDRLDRMNRRAVKLGMDPMTLTVVSDEWIKRTRENGLDYNVHVNHVEITGSVPRINGWEVVARIEFTDAGNLVHVAPHIDSINNRYRTIENICEHCNTKRHRNDVIAIRHEDGRELIVGRNCLADYIRTSDATSLIDYAKIAATIGSTITDCIEEEREYYGECGRPVESIETIIRAASICIRKLGWRSGSNAYRDNTTSTKDDVQALLNPPRYDTRGYKDWKRWIEECELTVSDYDKDLAAKAIEWAQSLEPGDSEYLHNLKVLAQLEFVTFDKWGYIVSMVPAYKREMEKELKRKEYTKKHGEKVYIGEPKKRLRGIKATCKGVNSFEGHYGVTTLIRFEHRIDDSSYAVLIWWASGDKSEDFDVDEEYTFDATVKGHDDHEKYGMQTKVNRLSVK